MLVMSSLSNRRRLLAHKQAEWIHGGGLRVVVRRSRPQIGIDLTYVKQFGEPDGDAEKALRRE